MNSPETSKSETSKSGIGRCPMCQRPTDKPGMCAPCEDFYMGNEAYAKHDDGP